MIDLDRYNNLRPINNPALEEKTDAIAKSHGCDRGTFTVCWGEYEDGLVCRCKEEARKALALNPTPRPVAKSRREEDMFIPATERETLRVVMEQAQSDLKSAHAEIVKLQGGDPDKHDWPEWSPQANTLRWFKAIRQKFDL